jgi:hypothetical protein
MADRTLTDQIGTIARAIGPAILQAAHQLPPLKYLTIGRYTTELIVQPAADAADGFGELLAVAQCAKTFGTPVTLDLDYHFGGMAACTVDLDGVRVSVLTGYTVIPGHQAQTLGELLGRDLDGDDVELSADVVLAAIKSAGGTR